MPQNANVAVPAKTWTQITNGNITGLRVQQQGPGAVLLQATVGAVAPSDAAGSYRLTEDEPAALLTLANIWPGVVGANRVYAWSEMATTVSVSHA